MICKTCNGTGTINGVDLVKAKRKMTPCHDCEGTGQVEKVRDGIFISAPKVLPDIRYIQQWEDGKRISTMECWMYPLKPFIIGGKPEVLVEIHNMRTILKRQKQGSMQKCFDAMVNAIHPKVIVSNYDDSTEAGRSFLEKNGFKHILDQLVWRP